MKSFDHIDVGTVDEAVRLLGQYKGKAKIIAGGTDLLGALKHRILPSWPDTLINIKTVDGLAYIREDAEGLKIGALTKLSDITGSPMVRAKWRILAEAADSVAGPQIRNMASIGGNLCQDVRCWYYRYPHEVGERFLCYLKGGKGCYALTGENQCHSIYGSYRTARASCSSACPGGMDAPLYVSRIREGDLLEAARIVLRVNPMPSITGRVCPHFCEQECNRASFDEPVSLRAMERFVGDFVLEKTDDFFKPPATETGKNVAIVGAGPAGLSAAYYLRISGHRVTVFDRAEKPGGMLAHAIPAYRLPRDIVDRVTNAIKNTGVEIRLETGIGADITLDALKTGFDSMFFATGASNQPAIGLEGEELTKSGLNFLTDIHRGAEKVAGARVVVIGGGNVAVDAAISAMRLGAHQVTLACLEAREEMPALAWETEQAIEEGVTLMPSWGPYRVLYSDGKVYGLELVQCTSVFDAEGNFNPTFCHEVKQKLEVDRIIMAVGQRADLSFVDGQWPLKVHRGLIVVDHETQETNMPGVFAGGDVTSGPASVVQAIAAGRRAAVAIDKYLRGIPTGPDDTWRGIDESLARFSVGCVQKSERVKTSVLPINKRGVELEDALGLDSWQVETEANRCFNCGCVAVDPSDIAVALTALGAEIEIAGAAGTRVLAIEDFLAYRRQGLKSDELVTAIRVPYPADTARTAFFKFRPRGALDFATVSAALMVTMNGGVCEDVRIALGGVAPITLRATGAEKIIKGRALDAAFAEAAGREAVNKAIPLGKNGYKVRIVKALIEEALLANSEKGVTQ